MKDTFNVAGLHELFAVFTEYRENLSELTFEPEDTEMLAVNPKAFSVAKDIDDITNNSSETAKILRELFTANPKAKVFRIDISPTISKGEGCPVAIKGGTITISGTF